MAYSSIQAFSEADMQIPLASAAMQLRFTLFGFVHDNATP